ncbi:MAG: choice-of-anchor J domain-containing protein [Bacilli bacterium]|nr:choice-of-anchor J domain-containing protein [Bacilli bacterium]
MKNNYKFCITLFITILTCITTLISVGFSALNQNLTVSGDVEYEEHDDSKLLYDVLKREARLGTYAKEYTGTHHDSFTDEPTKNIYHWYASNDTNANTILDKWNVIFGGFCWQMIRTTDTGGVKLLYNGTPSNGKCNRTGTGQQIGTSTFNNNYEALADVGYMYNTRYIPGTKSENYDKVITNVVMTAGSYYYGTGVNYDSSTGKYTLTGTTEGLWKNSYSSVNGLYTCPSQGATSCSAVYYIIAGESGFVFGFRMENGHMLNYYNTNLTLGTGYTESNGTYTLTNAITIQKADWYSNYSTYETYYTCGDDSASCTDLRYITYPDKYNGYYYVSLLTNNYIYANGFTYDSGTDKYTLSSDRYQTWNITNTDKTNLATHHYTCFNRTGECQTLSYVYYVIEPYSTSGIQYVKYIYYINLTGGKSVENALDEMLYNDDINTTNSTIKAYIDNWYSNNMISYTSYLEDTIFCNNRSQKNPSANEWNPNGGGITTYMYFNYDSLICINDTDKFSVSNNKAKLTYPIGLASRKEMELLNNNNLRKTGQDYWLGAPVLFYYYAASEGNVNYSGNSTSSSVHNTYGVRPAVSLKPGTEYTSGTGSKNDPYVVESTRNLMLFSEDFESGSLSNDWTNLDADGDEHVWGLIGAAGDGGGSVKVHSGNYAVSSQSFDNGNGSNAIAINADNYLITPAISLSNYENITLDFWAVSQDVNYLDSMEVLYGPTPDPSQMTTLIGLHQVPDDWTEYNYSLGEYDESTLYIAFRHKDYDKFWLNIDDITVYGDLSR